MHDRQSMTNASGPPPTPVDTVTGVLTIDLDAVAANYAGLCSELGDVDCGACVKADAYGLGMEPVARTLRAAGCRDFFVAIAAEGITLRTILPDARIHVFAGLSSAPCEVFFAHRLVPVLNTLGDISCWQAACRARSERLPCDLHIDTGMSRLGLDQAETASLIGNPDLLGGLALDVVMSHLASADVADSLQNAEQLAEFVSVVTVVREHHPTVRASLCNSSGIFLGAGFHFNLGRPGAALYGINPTPWTTSPVNRVVDLKGKILQTRLVDTPRTVGYGATHAVIRETRLATVGAGYADGYVRNLSGTGKAYIGGVEVPVVGRVSMDMITLDITALAADTVGPGDWVDLIGGLHNVDALATEAGTIGYEILTSLGRRYHRHYVGGMAERIS